MNERSDRQLIDVTDIVRRVVASRVTDRELVEDLTQETLVRVAAARPRLDDEALKPYAIVTARNLIANHGRTQAMHGRHVHRLVEYRGLEGPEQLALEAEETDALAVALDRLEDDERALLLRHETEGVDLDTLAEEGSTTSGAIAMRLARARATLRLEFVLAFRRVELPTDRCRAVLLALSAGDRRRQRRLGASSHLSRCTTCNDLARSVSERNRAIAGWLIIPAFEAVRRAVKYLASSQPVSALRTSRAAQAAAAATVVTGALVAVFVVRSGDAARQADPPPAAPVPATATQATAIPATAAPLQSDPAPTTRVPAEPAPRPTAPVCANAVKLDVRNPAAHVGCRFALTTLDVRSVPADEGFWARGQGRVGRVWVVLVGRGESRIEVGSEQRVSVSGKIMEPPSDPTAIGLGPAGRQRVDRSGYYLEVAFDDIAPG